MVYRKTNERKTIIEKSNLFILISLLGILVATCTLVGIILINDFSKPEPEPVNLEPESIITEEVDLEPSYPLIDFQPVVDDFVRNNSGNKSIVIFDLENNETVGVYNPDETYNTASLYKLFVVYEGYRRIQSGQWNPNDVAGKTGSTIIDCLDKSIRESHSECAETIKTLIGYDTLNEIIDNDFGIHNTNTTLLISTPRDVMSMMKIYYEHPDITNESLIETMKDSFLNQPITVYNWRQGLPSGFTKANVYNKVGWDFDPDRNIWNIYHDAAIVEFPDLNRHYIVVVMTNYVPFQKITAFGKQFEEYFYNNQ